jgi:hypothetical protein
VYVSLHLLLFDHLVAYSVNSVYQGASAVSVLDHHLSFGDRVYRLYGLFIDRRFGIGRWAPLFLVLLPALPLLLGRERLRLAVAALIVLQIAIATFLAITMMGFWFPGRTLTAVLPLMVFPLTLLVLRLDRAWRWGLAGLAGLSLVNTASLVYATRSGEVSLAVDPFAMSTPGFQLVGRLFPNYQAWTAETVALTLIWLVLFATMTAALVRPRLRRLAALLPGWRLRLPAPARGHSSGAPPP